MSPHQRRKLCLHCDCCTSHSSLVEDMEHVCTGNIQEHGAQLSGQLQGSIRSTAAQVAQRPVTPCPAWRCRAGTSEAREALKLLLSPEGRFFREFITRECVLSIDALSLRAAGRARRPPGAAGRARLPVLLPGAARPW